MKKISTLFNKDPNDLGRVINEINPENEWALSGAVATRKWDGTACAVINGELYKRYDVKKGRSVPENAIPCQEPDVITGHWPHWVKCDRKDKADRWHFEAFDKKQIWADGTYELCGPKIQGNPENLEDHQLIRHGEKVYKTFHIDYNWIWSFLLVTDIEGVVLHQPLTGLMCKIRKSDFGIKR
jgi:hypothetical protein